MRKKINECPKCGCEVYYTKDFVYGSVRTHMRFDGKNFKEYYNGGYYDGLQYKVGKKIYCADCHRCLGDTSLLGAGEQ